MPLFYGCICIVKDQIIHSKFFDSKIECTGNDLEIISIIMEITLLNNKN